MKNLQNWFGFKNKKPVRKSNIETFQGDEYYISRSYKKFCDNEEYIVTSVSITRVDHAGGKGYVNEYMFAISYDYFTEV